MTRPKPPRSVWVALSAEMFPCDVTNCPQVAESLDRIYPDVFRYDLHRPAKRKAKSASARQGRKGWTSTDARCLKLGRGRKR